MTMRAVLRVTLSCFTLTACAAAPGDDTGGASTGSTGAAGTEGPVTEGPVTEGPVTEGSVTEGGTEGATDGGATIDDATTGSAGVCTLVEVSCVDASIQDLGLHDDKVSAAEIENARDGADWRSIVDASAGGTPNAPMNPWVYLRFTAEGLVRVELDDVSSLESGDWDIAAKRYGIRVNSGVSGPSCVGVADLGGTYAEISAAPADDLFALEDYYDETCTMVEDGSGLPGSPAYRMASWWGYTGCVTTTDKPFVLRLADGRTLKLVVEAYYEQGQDACDTGGAMGTGAGIMTWRWSFLP